MIPITLTDSYNQVIDNETNSSNPFMIQTPDKNTNMFIDIRTSLFAMYLFLTGMYVRIAYYIFDILLLFKLS